jgi:hypothetical protein
VWRFTASSRLRTGRSFLPALADAVGCSIYLLDPSGGVRGVRAQLAAIGELVGVPGCVLVDVGGDILARGSERGLRSPTADAIALAASEDALRSRTVVVLGGSLDGELTRRQWRAAWRAAATAPGWEASVSEVGASAADFVRPLFAWHPSEVAGLACLAALGYRGRAELRAEGLHVEVDREAASMHRFEHGWVMARNRVAQAIRETSCLEEVEAAVRATVGRSELDQERELLARGAAYRTAALCASELSELEADLLDYSARAREQGVRFLTLRRVGELLGLAPRPLDQLQRSLARRHPGRLEPPVWRCDR